jgi:glutamine amidotransferase-like protein
MCGLIGYSGKTNFKKKWIDLIIAWNSMKRGEDSTGLYSPLNGLKKSLDKGEHFILYDRNKYLLDKMLIAHVRHSTVGAKTLDNAHPFERENYILAHNGTLTNHYALLSKYELPYVDFSGKVDSDMLLACIAKSQSFDPLKQIAGAGAFLIHDKNVANTLYVFKNKERPLFKCTDEDGNMYISSIDEPLYFLGMYEIEEFKDDILYTIVEGKITKEVKIKNKPVTFNTTPINSTSTIHANNYIMNNLRCTRSICVGKPGVYVELVKDIYYLCLEEKGDNIEILYDNKKVEMSKRYFDMDDIIYKEDYVMLLEDKVESTDPNRKGIIGNSGDIFIAETLYHDGDISVKDGVINKGYFQKSKCRRLTLDECIQYEWCGMIEGGLGDFHIKNKKTTPVVDNTPKIDVPVIQTVGPQNNPIITQQALNSKIGDSYEIPNVLKIVKDPIKQNDSNTPIVVSPKPENYYNLYVNEDDVMDFMDNLDNEVENLNTLIQTETVSHEMKKQITKLLDYITINRDKVLPNEIHT